MIEHKPRTGGRKKRPAPAEPLDPLEAAIAQYLDWIAAHNFSEDTVNTRRAYLGYFHDWRRERGLGSATGSPRRSMTMTAPAAASPTSSEVRV